MGSIRSIFVVTKFRIFYIFKVLILLDHRLIFGNNDGRT